MNCYKFTKEQIEYAANNTPTAIAAARMLGVKFDTYKKYALLYDCYKKNQAGIGLSKSKRYTEKGNFNYFYFDKINDYNKAYLLGYLAADSAPSDAGLRINISSVDVEILEHICVSLKVNKDQIKHYKTSCNSDGDKKYHVSTLYLGSRHLIQTIAKYNIIRNRIKNNLNMLNSIPEKYKDSWIAGYIDGNGYFSNSGCTIQITTNQQTCNAIIEHCRTYSPNIRNKIINKNNYVSLTINDREFVIRYLFSSTFHLSRKKEKAEIMMHKNICYTTPKNAYLTNVCIDCGKTISIHSVRCKSCSSYFKGQKQTKCPDKETLLNDLKCCNFCKVAKMYGVTDNTVRKWCRNYNLPNKTKDLKIFFST